MSRDTASSLQSFRRHGHIVPWAGDLVARIAAESAREPPSAKLVDRRIWRDRRLTALAPHKRAVSEQIGDRGKKRSHSEAESSSPFDGAWLRISHIGSLPKRMIQAGDASVPVGKPAHCLTGRKRES
jgi:hypothetical protein